MTLENFVMEQSINTSSVDDILLEQAIAEFEVANAIFECYKKEEILQEYCTNVSEFEVFQEGDKLNKVKSGVKNAGRAVGGALKAAWEMFLRAVENFFNLFRKTNFGKYADSIVGKNPDILDQNDYKCIYRVTKVFDYTDELADMMRMGVIEKRRYTELQHKLMAALEVNSVNYSKTDIVDKLMDLDKRSDKFAVGFHNLRKKVNFEDFKKRLEDNDVEDRNTIVTIINGILRELTDVYIGATNVLKKLMSKINKDTKKHDKEQKAAAKKAGKNSKSSEDKSTDDDDLYGDDDETDDETDNDE